VCGSGKSIAQSIKNNIGKREVALTAVSSMGFRDAGMVGPEISLGLRGSMLVLSAELPGFPRENLIVETIGRTLFLRGRRPEPGPGVPVRLERRGGDFVLGIPLPEGLDPSGISACLKNGVLEVSCPLGNRAHQIPVSSGEDGVEAASLPGLDDFTGRKEQ
jgi:HSP20 family molecular chaperone IbpA